MPSRLLRTIGLGCILILLATSVTGCALLGRKAPATVKIVPATSTIQVGQQVELLVAVENVKNLYGAELTIEFAPHLLTVIDATPDNPEIEITPGDLLKPDMIATNRAEDGKIEYAIVQVAPSEPADGNGTIARILLKGESPGTTAITLSVATFYDQNNKVLAITPQNGMITVEGTASPAETQPTATPLPLPTITPVPVQPTTEAQPTLSPSDAMNCGRVIGYHTVKRGETLYAIGRVYATRPDAIATCNNLDDPAKIHAGNRLAIPYSPWSPIPPGPVAERQFTPDPNP